MSIIYRIAALRKNERQRTPSLPLRINSSSTRTAQSEKTHADGGGPPAAPAAGGDSGPAPTSTAPPPLKPLSAAVLDRIEALNTIEGLAHGDDAPFKLRADGFDAVRRELRRLALVVDGSPTLATWGDAEIDVYGGYGEMAGHLQPLVMASAPRLVDGTWRWDWPAYLADMRTFAADQVAESAEVARERGGRWVDARHHDLVTTPFPGMLETQLGG